MSEFKFQPSELNPNKRDLMESVYLDGGLWERNNGRHQTGRFAHCFHRHVSIPWPEFSVLGVGCALGDAAPVWHEKYPRAKLQGCDVAETAVKRAKERYGHIADFFRAGLDEIQGAWDVVYCSNTLEHFEEYVEIAEMLLARCKVLFVLTPFAELRNGSPLELVPDQMHVRTFFKNSFDELVRRGKAARIETAVFRCPGAWGFRSRFGG